jgi:hypothetical protein
VPARPLNVGPLVGGAMGTRIDVYLSHDLPCFDDAAGTIARLNSALPAAFAVRDYWRSVDPDTRQTIERWEAEPVTPRMPKVPRYSGPGALYLTVTPAAARISTGGRWRGFLSIEPLRQVHLAAFRAIARAMGSARLALCADSRDDVTDVFLADGSQDDCIAAMRSAMGPPQPSVESIAPDVVAQTEHGVPSVWFLDGHPAAD